MRNRLSKLLFLIPLMFTVNCFSECASSESGTRFMACPKTYVTTDQIAFYENGIFAKIGDSIISTSAIYSDESGYYFSNYNGDCEGLDWKCPCGECNPFWYTTCRECFRLR